MTKRKTSQHYSALNMPSLEMSELVRKTLDHDATDVLIDKWLEHRNDAYWDWFNRVRERKHAANQGTVSQILLWNKGDFVPENVFCRTVDTKRLIPLDRTWTTHVYYHRTMQERKLSMMPVVFTMLPELMLLRGMHDHGCDEMFIIVTDMKRKEMDDVTEYFKLVCRSTFGRTPKPSVEQQILLEHMRLSHTLNKQRRLPCFPQIDLTFRAILHEKRPPFIVLFSHQATSYSQIFFTNKMFVPAEDIFYDFPSGCPNPSCTEDCEMIRFPRRGAEGAAVLSMKKGGKRAKAREMCNWIDCTVCFSEELLVETASEGSEGSQCGEDAGLKSKFLGQVCSRCKLVKYCSPEHQKMDWDEHKRVCVKPVA
ncbi:hypothetical protein OE88DRAFT_1734334 [Heliocybe sulcata]|uniref:MYND-type domain-containing protein n=1 Tax=Heliocybe sulcata TaxID=5364 RepID=A0A5C3N5J9_9AGAM|nr:hypothetical protein OE88DRAFT_1734334 [Heliocybe sulcata]